MDREQFEEEKTAIFEQALHNMEQIKTNITILNTNIQTMNSIGQQFEESALLWDAFHKALGSKEVTTQPESHDLESNQKISNKQQHDNKITL
jgi:hypothetical protein